MSLNVHQLYELEFICIVLLFKTHYEFQFSRNPVFFASRNQFQGRIKPKVCADQFQVRIKPKVCADFLHFYQLFAGSVLLLSRKSSVTCYFVASFTKSHRFGTSPLSSRPKGGSMPICWLLYQITKIWCFPLSSRPKGGDMPICWFFYQITKI